MIKIWGIDPGFHPYHPDEHLFSSDALRMIEKNDFSPSRYDYPMFISIIHFILFKLLFIPLSWLVFYIGHLTQLSTTDTLKIFHDQILGVREINALYWSRYITAFFGFGALILIYKLGKQLFNKYVGIIAAFLLSFSLKYLMSSQLSLPDIYNSFFLLLSLLFTIKILHKPTMKNYLIAGFFIGLSISVKYQFIALIPFSVVHIFTCQKGRFSLVKFFNKSFLAALLVAVIIFALLNIYIFFHFKEVMETLSYISAKYLMGIRKVNLFPIYYLYSSDFGAVEIFAVLLGIIIGIRKYLKASLIILSATIFHLFVFLYFSGAALYARNYVTVIPFFILFAALAIWEIDNFLKKKFRKWVAASVLGAMIFTVAIFPIKNSLIHAYYYTKPWNYSVFGKWVQKNIPQNSVVAAQPFDYSAVKLKTKRVDIEAESNYSLAELRESKAEYALINLDWARRDFSYWIRFGSDWNKIYWSEPIDEMRNIFTGLAMEELLRYKIFSVIKPWQAPETNLIAIKIPDPPKGEYTPLTGYKFNEDINGWKIKGKNNTCLADFKFDKAIGYSQKGSIMFMPGYAVAPTIRMTSPLIPVKPGFLYKINGFLRTEKLLPITKREGFLRIDFYDDNVDTDKAGIVSAVSSRVYGTDQWVKKEVIGQAPPGAKYLTVSFQVYITDRWKVWLDDVTVEESEKPTANIFPAKTESQYQQTRSDIELLYSGFNGTL